MRAPDAITRLGLTGQLFIGGEWSNAAGGETLYVIDPATGDILGQVACAGAADVDRSVVAARAAAQKWRGTAPETRARILLRVADLIEKYADQVAALESMDNGMSIGLAHLLSVANVAATFRYFAGWATKIDGITTQTNLRDVHAYTLREPYGVCGLITPWNAPLAIASWKLAPCLAAGNTAVLKPSEETTLTALFLGRVLAEAGLPAGVVNIIPGVGSVAGAALAAHHDVDALSFTGSTETGRAIVRAALGNMKKVTLELGGKSPNAVFADADLDRAVPGSAMAIFLNSGQVCVAGSRLYVQRPIYGEFVDRMAAFARQMHVGPGARTPLDLGPLISQRQLDRVSGMIERSLQQGADLVSGGKRRGESGFFMEPTILADVRQDMEIVRAEVFGPVVVATPFDAFEDLIAACNDTTYGLGASVWTNNLSTAHHFAGQIKAGAVWINTHGVMDHHLPIGGYKQSGWGRDLGEAAIEGYTQIKSVIAQLDPGPRS